MLVFLQDPPNPTHTCLHHLSDTTMAPQLLAPSTLVFDSRTQIIDNCEFLISKFDIVQVITSKDPADKLFKAYAIKCGEDTREVILVSEPCETAEKAIESLHTKSCEAIHNYTTTNGFSIPRDLNLKTAVLEPGIDDDDTASVTSGRSDSSTAALSEWGSSGDETMMMLDDASSPNRVPKDTQHPDDRLGNQIAAAASAHEPVRGSHSRAAVRSSSDYPNPAPPRARVARPARSRSPSFAFRQAPPPPPPGYPAHLKSDGPPAPPPSVRGIPVLPFPHPHPARMGPGPHHPLRPQNGMNPRMPPAQPLTCFRLPGLPIDRAPFPASQGGNRLPMPTGLDANALKRSGDRTSRLQPSTGFHPNSGIYTVCLTVHWVGHGQHRIISHVHPTMQALQDTAIADVRLHSKSFTGEGPSMKGAAGPSNRDGSRPGLVAHVRRCLVAGEMCEMQGMQAVHDLTLLFETMAIDGMPTFEVVVNDISYYDDDEASIRGLPGSSKSEGWE
ncbi:hypothetical protein F5B21DRAFT_292097 [Xylaria acuta]|nr:hypothetical protein F5B21DRAFT_292097 [Xylaria acuta]